MIKICIEYFPNLLWKISSFERTNSHPYDIIKIEELKNNISRLLRISCNSINDEFIQQTGEINTIEEAIIQNNISQSVNINLIREVTSNIHLSISSNFNDLQKNLESFNSNSYQQWLIVKRKLLIELVKTHAKFSALNSIIRKLYTNFNIKYQRQYLKTENIIPNFENQDKTPSFGLFNNIEIV